MSNWLIYLDIKSKWEERCDNKCTVQELAKHISNELENLNLSVIKKEYPDRYDEIEDDRLDLEMGFSSMSEDNSATNDDLDMEMETLYDWADQKFSDKIYGNALCWVKTNF